MGIWRGQFDGNSFLGLYARASDRLAIVPRGAPEKFLFGMKGLDVPVCKTGVDGSPYVGVYLAMNSNGLLAPPFLTKMEGKELQDTGLPITLIADTRYCAIANNVACNDHGAIVNPDMPHEMVKRVEKALGVPVKQTALAGYRTVGAMVVATNKGWLAHNRISDEEAGMLDDLFGVKGSNGTVNSGSAFVAMGVVANSKGLIVGESTSGFEEARMMQALDLV